MRGRDGECGTVRGSRRTKVMRGPGISPPAINIAGAALFIETFRIGFLLIGSGESGVEPRVADRRAGLVLDEVDLPDAEHRFETPRRHLQRTWTSAGGARRGLRVSGGQSGLEVDAAFDLLDHLVDVPVEHGDRAERPEIADRLRGVGGAPAPLG